MVAQRVLAQRLQLLDEGRTLLPGERARDADVVQVAAIVVQPQEQAPDMRLRAILVPPETGDDAVSGTSVLDLEHRPLARLVFGVERLGHDAVETRALETVEPVSSQLPISRCRREVDGRRRVLEMLLDELAPIGLGCSP